MTYFLKLIQNNYNTAIANQNVSNFPFWIAIESITDSYRYQHPK